MTRWPLPTSAALRGREVYCCSSVLPQPDPPVWNAHCAGSLPLAPLASSPNAYDVVPPERGLQFLGPLLRGVRALAERRFAQLRDVTRPLGRLARAVECLVLGRVLVRKRLGQRGSPFDLAFGAAQVLLEPGRRPVL